MTLLQYWINIAIAAGLLFAVAAATQGEWVPLAVIGALVAVQLLRKEVRSLIVLNNSTRKGN